MQFVDDERCATEYVARKLASHRATVSELESQLWSSRNFSDLVFVFPAESGREVRAHKAVLVTRCPMFASMFDCALMESATNRVVIDDVRSQLFEQVIHFIYTGEVDELEKIAKDLLGVADKVCIC